ncbi:MAG: T9SS type A sorting domain-containing protein [Ignavibacteria bacterium]|nr:T9SS type A sorting domain-containing protein [Ignavibacteria bacterium]
MHLWRFGIIVVMIALARGLCAQVPSWSSSRVYYGTDGKLVYVPDAEGNRIPDFSYAGYKNGNVPIPDVPVIMTISPDTGDNTNRINNAIILLSDNNLYPLNPQGTRGALLLTAGVYRVSGTINLNVNGVVLRGVGDGEDSTKNTIIVATGNTPHQRTVLIAGGPSETKWSHVLAGTQPTDIVSDTVYVGARTFKVADATNLNIGNNVIIYHPVTQAWLNAIGGGGTASDPPWTTSTAVPIVYNRYVVAKDGNTITIDAPLFATLVRSLSQSYVYRYARTNLRTNIGIERLRIVIEAPGTTTDANGDENHAWDAVLFRLVEDAWARKVTTLHFGQSGFKTATASRITIDSCSAIRPISIIDGERRYNFNTYTASNLILFKDCYASYGRHDYVSNGTSLVSGIVFYNCVSDSTYNPSEGHRWWSQGLLYDNLIIRNPTTTGMVLGLYNRGDYGTGHGWAAVHSVAWNVNAGTRRIIIQKPPTAQNYAIGCVGTVTGTFPPAPFNQPEGFIEGTGRPGLWPQSLYLAQLQERLNPPTSVTDRDKKSMVPSALKVYPSFPNPFNPSTTIAFDLPVRGHTVITVYDLIGRKVEVFVEETLDAGYHTVRWNARKHPSGIYFVRVEAGSSRDVQKVVLSR